MMGSQLFHGLSRAEVEEIAIEMREQHFRRGELIFHIGQSATSVLVIRSGIVKITLLSRTGKEVILRVAGGGEVIGSPSPSPAAAHTVSAQAITSCRVLLCRAAALDRFSERLPALQHNVRKILAERLRALEERFFDLATQPVPQRLARLLVRFHERSCIEPRGDHVSLSCEELAQMTGTTLFTVSRLLAEWEERGIIHREQRVIAIENLDLLVGVAEGIESSSPVCRSSAE